MTRETDETKRRVKGFAMLSVGVLMIYAAAAVCWTIPVAFEASLAISGAWVFVYGIGVLSDGV